MLRQPITNNSTPVVQLESQDNWLIGGTQDNGTLGNATGGVFNQIAEGDGGDCGSDDVQKLCYHPYYGMEIERAPALGQNAFDWVDASPPVADDYEALRTSVLRCFPIVRRSRPFRR